MSISADHERSFYDAEYAQFLNLPASDLVCNRRTLEADLANPAKSIYERRRLYSAILQTLLAEPVAGRAVLDYGCGTGDWGLMLAAACVGTAALLAAVFLRTKIPAPAPEHGNIRAVVLARSED